MQDHLNNINIRKELSAARDIAFAAGRNGSPKALDAWWEVCCGLVLLAEDNIREQHRQKETTDLALEFLDISKYLEGYDHMLSRLSKATERMSDTVYGHPRLRLRLLKSGLGIIRRIEAMSGHDLDAADELVSEIALYEHNISMADTGQFDKIRGKGHIKNDPIEWSKEYEEIIDEANEKISTLLSGYSKGMGFCHAYWRAKASVLEEEYGISWKSPAILNPRVMFD